MNSLKIPRGYCVWPEKLLFHDYFACDSPLACVSDSVGAYKHNIIAKIKLKYIVMFFTR